MNTKNSDSTNNELNVTETILNQNISAVNQNIADLNQNVADVIVALVTIVGLLRKQPGFDNEKFLDDVQTSINSNTKVSDVTKKILSYLLDNPKAEDNL